MFVERVKFIIAVVIYGTIGAIYHSNRNVLYQKNSWETSGLRKTTDVLKNGNVGFSLSYRMMNSTENGQDFME